MPLLGSMLKNRRAGEAFLAWNLPNLSGPDTLTLSSQAFADGAPIPVLYTMKRTGGQNESPDLAWDVLPAGTAQVLLVVQDTDSPTSHPFVHCVALVEPLELSLPAGALSAVHPGTGVQLLRSGMGRGYVGPAPIKGHGPHHYVFQAFALSAPMTDVTGVTLDQAKPREVLASVSCSILARGRLTGTYER